jgi:hypothetical protein
MKRQASQRGQAVTELALGLLVFITILLFGIHFAEIGYLSVKVPQAGAHAMWEATGKRPQTITPRANKMTDVVEPSATAAEGRFANFDPARSGGGTVRLSLTQARDMRVQCSTLTGTALSMAPTAGVGAAYLETGAMRCSASATLAPVAEFPASFQERQGSRGFFQEAHYAAQPLQICGIGRAIGGSCQGELAMLLNDWGLTGTNEASDCPRGFGCNVYRGAVRRNFGGGGQAGADFARKYAGSAPTSADAFYMSYSGLNNGYKNSVFGESGGDYNTGGPGPTKNGQWVPSTVGNNCFLGMSGC